MSETYDLLEEVETVESEQKKKIKIHLQASLIK